MRYNEFKKEIEKVKVVDEKLYNQLIEENGKELIDNFFEMYIKDTSVEDNIDKFNRTDYYLSITPEQNDENELYEENKDTYFEDSIRMYLREIGSVPLLTQEEETELAIKINEYKEILFEKGINIEKINDELSKLDYKITGNDNTLNGLNNKIFYLEKIIKQEETPKKIKQQAQKTLKKINIYKDYKTLHNKFVSSNLRLVVSIAKRYKGRGVSLSDLIQEGNLGLEKAVEKFNVNKGYKLSTYATWWITQAITRAIADQSRTIRVPVHLHETINKYKFATIELEFTLQRSATDEEILEYFKNKAIEKLKEKGITPTEKEIKKETLIDEEKLKTIKKIEKSVTSLDTPVGEEEDAILLDFIPDNKSTSVEAQATFYVTKNYINNVFNSLTIKEKFILTLRTGLKISEYISFEKFKELFKKQNISSSTLEKIYNKLDERQRIYTLEEIGQILSLTRERIRQLEDKGMKKLKIRTRRDEKHKDSYLT